MEIAEFQALMRRTYGERDRVRGVPATVAWLTEELGELAQAVRKGTPRGPAAGAGRRAGLAGVAGRAARPVARRRRPAVRRRLSPLRARAVHLLITAATTTEPLYDAERRADRGVVGGERAHPAGLRGAGDGDPGAGAGRGPVDHGPAGAGRTARAGRLPRPRLRGAGRGDRRHPHRPRRPCAGSSSRAPAATSCVVRVPRREARARWLPTSAGCSTTCRGLAVGGVVPAGALDHRDRGRVEAVVERVRGEVVRRRPVTRGCAATGGPPRDAALRRRGDRRRAGAVGGRRLPRPRGGRHGPLWFAAVLAIIAVIAVGAVVARSRPAARHRRRTGRGGPLARAPPLPRRPRRLPDAPAPSVAIWDAYLGWAAALGLAPIAVESLPLGTEDDQQAWSSVGGHVAPGARSATRAGGRAGAGTP